MSSQHCLDWQQHGECRLMLISPMMISHVFFFLRPLVCNRFVARLACGQKGS